MTYSKISKDVFSLILSNIINKQNVVILIYTLMKSKAQQMKDNS